VFTFPRGSVGSKKDNVFLRKKGREIMQALKLQSHIGNDGVLTIQLPEDFWDKDLEVIVLYPEEQQKNEQNLKELLLQAPTLTDEELKNFNDVREWMNKWRVKEF
jgi:hypothetical protein